MLRDKQPPITLLRIKRIRTATTGPPIRSFVMLVVRHTWSVMLVAISSPGFVAISDLVCRMFSQKKGYKIVLLPFIYD